MINTLLDHPTIWATGVVEELTYSKLAVENVNSISDILLKNITISSYGATVEELAFIYIAVEPINTIHEEKTTYIPKQKKLFLYRKLPYERVLEYSEEEVLRLMAETYLTSIQALGAFEIPDFDYLSLAKDVQQAFVNMGWIIDDTCAPLDPCLNTNTIVAFLKSKNWEEKSRSPRYQVMSPPKNQAALKGMQLYIPLLPKENLAIYKLALSGLVALIARIYQRDTSELIWLFSKNKEQLEEHIELLQGVLKHIK